MKTMHKKILSIIIPVYNEENKINLLLENLPFNSDLYSYEIIVIDGNPSKNTIKNITIDEVNKLSSKPGRALQMNSGAESASGEILLFLHADTKLPLNAFEIINNSLANEKYVAGAFSLKIDNCKYSYRIIEFVANLRSRISRIPFGDQSIFIKKDFFSEIGGYKEIPLLEDVELMKRIRKAKRKIFISKSFVRTSSRKWEKEGRVGYFTNLEAWKIENVASGNADAAPPHSEDDIPPETEDDGLPF